MKIDDKTVMKLYRQMLTVRLLEEKVSDLVFDNKIPCSGHFGVGQEAVGVGVMSSLNRDDYMFGTHRGYAEYIGKGMAPEDILSEYFGKASSLSRGRAGQHLINVDLGIMPMPSSLGSEFGMSVGIALANKLNGNGKITVNIFGEGTAGQSDVGPSLEMAALWKLPLIFVCNNNQYVELDHYRNIVATEDIAPRAEAYGIYSKIIKDGNDILNVRQSMDEAVEYTRSGKGPVFLEFKTYRRSTHYTGDPGGYQKTEEITKWEANDPVDRCRELLFKEKGWNEELDKKLRDEVFIKITKAADAVESSPFPDPSTLQEHIYA
jgi:acetoin:2,6-dichlorophenolindophenol oxidoreductase subunit alpha